MIELHELISTMVLVASFMAGIFLIAEGKNSKWFSMGTLLMAMPVLVILILLSVLLPAAK